MDDRVEGKAVKSIIDNENQKYPIVMYWSSTVSDNPKLCKQLMNVSLTGSANLDNVKTLR